MTSDQQSPNLFQNLTQRLNVDFALKAAGLGVWEFDPTTGLIRWDERCRALYGLAEGSQITYEQVFQFIHPDDQALVRNAVQRVLTLPSDGQYDLTYRTLGADDGVLRWVRFMGKVDFTEMGEVSHFAGVAQDVTPQAVAQHQVEHTQQQLLAALNNLPNGLGLFVMEGPELTFRLANPYYCQLTGYRPEEIIGRPLLEVRPEHQEQPYVGWLREVMRTGEPFTGVEVPGKVLHNGQLKDVFTNFAYTPYRQVDGVISGVIALFLDVTAQVQSRQAVEASEQRYRQLAQSLEGQAQQRTQALEAINEELAASNEELQASSEQELAARQQLEESEARFRSLIEEAPVATCLFVSRELRIELANQAMIQVWGKGPGVLGLPLADALPELRTQHFLTTIDQVFTTGVAYSTKAGRADLVINGQLQTFYFDYDFNALRNGEGEIYAVMEMATDVTQQVVARQQLEEVEARLRAIVANLPSATVVFRGRELVVETPSKHFIDIIDRGPDVTGKPLGKLMPELESQSFLNILDKVYTTGQPYRAFGAPVNIRQADGSTVLDYFDLIYTPLFDAQSEVYAILSVATNVTEQLKAYQQVEASEAALRNAVELAQLGNFSVDVATNVITVSPRVADWFGFDSLFADAQSFINGVGERDREAVQNCLTNALQPGSDGRYDIVHSVVHAKTGQQIIIHALGQIYKDAAGQTIRLEGTCQDITSQRELQIVLEQQVQDRTEELAAANEEMAATNEELTATNEDMLVNNQALETANTDLVRSNQNLEQFAYIASHDLQEPLRKIQQFGDILQSQYGDKLGQGAVYIERVQLAASRMSVLIKDLLAFSRIATTQVDARPVVLSELVDEVLEDLSVAIEESGAQLVVDPLPTVQGDESQLKQLFQNLLSNALKFRRKKPTGEGITPEVMLRTRPIPMVELPPSVHPTRYADAYHLIEVSDNGIGFEEKYLDRIFQVFQRLHGKNEFAGTGVGLAIVQKVVTNHGGAITATSQLGKGATFSVYLPA